MTALLSRDMRIALVCNDTHSTSHECAPRCITAAPGRRALCSHQARPRSLFRSRWISPSGVRAFVRARLTRLASTV